MDDYIEPAVTERPMRGREMKTTVVPTDMFDTMKLVSTKHTLGGKHSVAPELASKSERTAELYHEGYVDGKLYLVPDSNLEAMRDMINFKMTPRRSTRYKHQTSFELTEYDHFRGKLKTLLEKIEEISSESEEEEEEEAEEEEEQKVEEEQKKEPKVVEEEKVEEEKVEEEKVEEEKVEEERVEEEKAEEEEEEERVEEEEPPPKPVDPNRLRFLISGHFQKDQKPIYIIQDYRGGPDLFREQKADFYTKQREDDVDLTISGRFYDEVILEEHEGKPKALNIKPFRILIDEKRSNVYDDYFKQVYKFNSVDITLKGEFIKSRITKKTTPFLTLDLKHKHPAEPNLRSEREENYHTTPSTAVLVYKPEYDNPFAKGDENFDTFPVYQHDQFWTNELVLQSSIGVLSHAVKNVDDIITSESSDESTTGDLTHQSQYFNENELKTEVSVKPYDLNTHIKLATLASNNVNNETDINNSSEHPVAPWPSYSKDLEQLDYARHNENKIIKKRKSLQRGNSVSPPRTTGSSSFPTLREKSVKQNEEAT